MFPQLTERESDQNRRPPGSAAMSSFSFLLLLPLLFPVLEVKQGFSFHWSTNKAVKPASQPAEPPSANQSRASLNSCQPKALSFGWRPVQVWLGSSSYAKTNLPQPPSSLLPHPTIFPLLREVPFKPTKGFFRSFFHRQRVIDLSGDAGQPT